LLIIVLAGLENIDLDQIKPVLFFFTKKQL